MQGFDPDRFARRIHDNLWNGDGTEIRNYAQDVSFEGATDRSFQGRDPYQAYIAQIRSIFPDLKRTVDEVYWMGNEHDSWLISTRWSADATHKVEGCYGRPSDAPCQLWGITQWRVIDGTIRQEWQLFNEFDLMIQIARARA